MATRQETKQIAAAFQRYNKTNNTSEIEIFTLAELIRADEDLAWRDKDSNFRLALKNRIKELEKVNDQESTVQPQHHISP